MAQLNQTIQELKEQLNKNSRNSSRSPSSDGLKSLPPKASVSRLVKKQVVRMAIREHILPIVTGTISNMVKRFAGCLTDTVSEIKQKMIGSGLGHFDETGTRVDKKSGGSMIPPTVSTPIWIYLSNLQGRKILLRKPQGKRGRKNDQSQN